MARDLPIVCRSIAAHVIQIRKGKARFLLLRRRGTPLDGTWQTVAGKIEPGESAAQAAAREILEETGIAPQRLYSADAVECFYSLANDAIDLAPVFVAFAPPKAKVKIGREHRAYRWVSAKEARRLFDFSEQRRIVAHVKRCFVDRKPLRILEVNRT